MDIKYLYENTEKTLGQISEELGIGYKIVWNYVYKNYTKEHRVARKRVSYRNSKLGDKNPQKGKKGPLAINYVGIVSYNKGYWMQVKPDWYTGRKNSKHVFVHHLVVCEHLGITEIPKGWTVHHCDFDSSNNSFDNLVLMLLSDHCRLHQLIKGNKTVVKEEVLDWVKDNGTWWCAK